MKIYAPVKDANGVYASVRFVNGVGETDNPRLIEWFKTHGYSLEECENPSEKPHEKCDEKDNESEFVEINNVVDDEPEMMGYSDKPVAEKTFEEMTPFELREWAKANGFGGVIKNTRNKEKLIELLRG